MGARTSDMGRHADRILQELGSNDLSSLEVKLQEDCVNHIKAYINVCHLQLQNRAYVNASLPSVLRPNWS